VAPGTLSAALIAAEKDTIKQRVTDGKLTQEQVAQALGVSQANVSQIEHQDNIYLRTLSSYIEALGGQLEVRAVFPDETVVLARPGVGPSATFGEGQRPQ